MRLMGHVHRFGIHWGGKDTLMATRPMPIVVMLAILCVWAVPVLAATHSIQNVNVSSLPDSVQITVKGSGALAVHPTRVGDRYIAFDIYGKLAAGEQKKVSIDEGGIRTVKCGWFRSTPPIARIVVATTGWKEYSVSQKDGQRLTMIKVQKAVSSSKMTETEVPIIGEPVLVASAKPIVVTPAAPKPKLISLDFVASDIHDVIKALAVQSGVNIVASPDVKGNVTVSLTNVTVEEALKLVTNLSGFRFAEVDGTYVIGTEANLRTLAAGGAAMSGNDKITEVVLIKYADPQLISNMLESQFGMVQVTKGGGGKDSKESAPSGPTAFILCGMPADVQGAKAMVETVDKSLASTISAAEIELYEVKYVDIKELLSLVMAYIPGLSVAIGPNQGFQLESPNAVAMGSNTGGSQSNAATTVAPPKILILRGSREDIDKAKDYLAKVDTQQPQIIIEAKVLDIKNNATDKLGIDWSWSSFLVGESARDETGAATGVTLGHFNRTPVEIAATVNALITQGNGKVLANPNVLALDGKPASIFIGDEVKYVIAITPSQSGVTVTTETARVGVQLHCISRISQDGYITMDLHPEVSLITNWRTFKEVNLSLPEISRRYVDTTVRVKDGETIVIGGLIKDEDLKNVSGIPFLQDLPILGGFFKSKTTSKVHSEVIMLITPRILSTT